MSTTDIHRHDFLNIVNACLNKENLNEIRKDIAQLKTLASDLISNNNGYVLIRKDNDIIEYSHSLIQKELDQIDKTQTIERTKYYIKRLIRSLSEKKTGEINDLNLNRWKEYDDLITDSLWMLNKRDKSGTHKADYWGNFIPQIPNQFLRRYTKKGDWVLDPFLGSGTSLIECRRLGRNGVGIELNKETTRMAGSRILQEKNPYKITTKVINANSAKLNYTSELKKLKVKSVQFLIMHPPYWNIIKFSNNKEDLSNAESVQGFLELFGRVVDKTYPLLDKKRYCSVIIGDKYSAGEWIPLGFYVMQEMINKGFKLKSIIVKNFDQTTAKRNQKELWRYRALAGGFYIFKHEYIFLFQK